MNVVDSSAWLSYFAGGKNSSLFAEPIVAVDKLLVPGITLTEIFKNILRQRNEESALEAIAHMERGNVIALPIQIRCLSYDLHMHIICI